MPEKPNQLIDPELQPHDGESGNNGVDISSQPLSVPHQPQQPPDVQQPSSQPQWGQQPPQQWQQPMPLQQEWQSRPQMYPPQPYGQSPQQYPPPQLYPPQQYPQMPPQPMNVNTIVNVNTQQQGPGFLVRALYFIFVGWWAGFWCLQIGFFLCALIVTLPIGLALLNRLPQIMTLKQSGQQTNVNVATTTYAGGVTNMVNVNMTGTQQHPMILRAIYYIFIGCWVGYLWASLAYGLCLTILGLPLGVMMLNSLPAVLTLRKN